MSNTPARLGLSTLPQRAPLPVAAALLCLLGAAGVSFSQTAPAAETATSGASATTQAAPGDPAAASQLAVQVRDLLPTVLEAGRSLLVGRFDPNRSCVSFIPVGALRGDDPPPIMIDSNGGFGRQMGYVYLQGGRGASPSQDFAWHQGLFRLILARVATENRKAYTLASTLALKARQLAESIDAQAKWSDDFVLPASATAPKGPPTWPGLCLLRLEAAAAAKDLAACKLWSAELASAAFALEDLHRWLGFLVQTQQTSLDFQAKCKSLFESCDAYYRGRYASDYDISFFPGGYLGLQGVANYLEVERQAQLLYQVPQAYRDAAAPAAAAATQSAIWLPPDVRESYQSLRSQLSPANQEAWDQAPHTPFERSYLANMLYRAQAAGVLKQMAVVLKRADAANPHANVHDLMAVLFYRGGDAYAGMEWADRFDPRLMARSAALAGDNQQVLQGAQALTFAQFGPPTEKNYETVLTLREAMDRGKIDCVRATDMIGSLYRNAGRAGFYSIRWCGGQWGHTVAAARTGGDGNRIVIVDGLAPAAKPVPTWPGAYFEQPAWPEGNLQQGTEVYAAELTERGLDSYVWVEGYILRGPNAGTTLRATIPYDPSRAALPEGTTSPASAPQGR